MSLAYLLALHSLNGLGNQKLKQLLDYFGDGETAWQNPTEWSDALQISKTAMAALLEAKRGIVPDLLYEQFLAAGAKVVTLADADYPALLRQIYQPPYLLFYKGTLPRGSDLAIAIIGSRKATSYGKDVAAVLGRDLAKAGVWVVSGLARGIDAAGHQGALAGGGNTIGVLGCGIDVIYPREHRELFQRVEEHGCIISDFPLGTQPLAKNFPVRNRIISGLANGLVVVEAAGKSGTQITVDFALEQGRDIFAVPGPIFSPLSQGTHRLIRDCGVKLVTCAADILEEYGQLSFDLAPSQPAKQKQEAVLSEQEEKLCRFLTVPRHFNDILIEMAMQPQELGPFLTVCELRGYISRLEGQYYRKKIQL